MADVILKRCCTCKTQKPRSEFGLSSGTKDGLRKRCKLCNNTANAASRAANPESSRASCLKWQKANRDKANEKLRRFANSNPGYMAAKQREWREKNLERARERDREANRRRLKNHAYRIHATIGNGLRDNLKNKRKGSRTFSILGYDRQDLLSHLERQFLPGMSWENFGKWHVDHIRPLASFSINGQDDPEVRIAWALSNLRPLWATDNLKKSDKLIYLV